MLRGGPVLVPQGPLLTALPDLGQLYRLKTGGSLKGFSEGGLRPHLQSTWIPELVVSSVFLKREISLTVIKFRLQRRDTAAYRSLAKFFCGGRGATPGTYTLEGFLALLVKSYAWDLVFSRGHTVPRITLEENCIKYFGSRNNPIFLMSACVSFKEKNIFVRKIGYCHVWIAIIVKKPWTRLWGLSSRLPHTSYYVWRGNAARPLPGVVTLPTNWPSPRRVTPSCYSLPWSSFFCTVSCPVTSSELKSLDRRDFKARVQQLLFQIPFGRLSSPHCHLILPWGIECNISLWLFIPRDCGINLITCLRY